MFNKKTIIEVDYDDLGRFIEAALGLEVGAYNFAEVEECSNDSIKRFRVTGEATSFDISRVARVCDGTTVYFATDNVLNYLCNEGHLEPGEYYVSVSW